MHLLLPNLCSHFVVALSGSFYLSFEEVITFFLLKQSNFLKILKLMNFFYL
jgi:hypothetical protein